MAVGGQGETTLGQLPDAVGLVVLEEDLQLPEVSVELLDKASAGVRVLFPVGHANVSSSQFAVSRRLLTAVISSGM